MNGLKKEISETLAACKAASGRPGASGYLPDVVESLHEMAKVVEEGGESSAKRRRRTGGLFRIVSDDVNLLNSKLGERIVDLMNDYRTWTPATALEREPTVEAMPTAKGRTPVAVTLKQHLVSRMSRRAATKPARHAR